MKTSAVAPLALVGIAPFATAVDVALVGAAFAAPSGGEVPDRPS